MMLLMPLLMASCNSTSYHSLDDVREIGSKRIRSYPPKNPTKKQKTALEDCTKNYDSSLADLDKVWGELNRNPNNKKLQQQSYADSSN
ncbi:hypothetical protein NC653_007849 [Populus alba x Populus x berolinensis]|uniref:Uncharacterized protein n=1 Tax=Populus alba x Populus x berolinensis TaxID=444605 RepID=A0AAD6R517_9ROSI|nr:hypothetical protein NC653_007849 [Populus alba x Populus x berolinensis]